MTVYCYSDDDNVPEDFVQSVHVFLTEVFVASKDDSFEVEDLRIRVDHRSRPEDDLAAAIGTLFSSRVVACISLWNFHLSQDAVRVINETLRQRSDVAQMVPGVSFTRCKLMEEDVAPEFARLFQTLAPTMKSLEINHLKGLSDDDMGSFFLAVLNGDPQVLESIHISGYTCGPNTIQALRSLLLHDNCGFKSIAFNNRSMSKSHSRIILDALEEKYTSRPDLACLERLWLDSEFYENDLIRLIEGLRAPSSPYQNLASLLLPEVNMTVGVMRALIAAVPFFHGHFKDLTLLFHKITVDDHYNSPVVSGKTARDLAKEFSIALQQNRTLQVYGSLMKRPGSGSDCLTRACWFAFRGIQPTIRYISGLNRCHAHSLLAAYNGQDDDQEDEDRKFPASLWPHVLEKVNHHPRSASIIFFFLRNGILCQKSSLEKKEK